MGTNSNSSREATSSSQAPSEAEMNSPRLLRSFSAFHWAGLWLAVRMMPASAFSPVTAISVVGVVLNPMSSTSAPMACKVPHTIWFTRNPDRRASRPTTMRGRSTPPRWINFTKAAVNFTMSIGVKLSPGRPPIVPRMPDMDLISVIVILFCSFLRCLYLKLANLLFLF